MAIDRTGSRPTTLLERVKGILLDPKAEWPRIAAEPATVGSIYMSYVVPLAGFAVACTLVRWLLGVEVMGISYRPGFAASVTTAIWDFAVMLAGVFVVALVVERLAPVFGGERSRIDALKLVAYSATAGWLSNVFVLIPWLGLLSILGIYSLYLLYTGAPVLMKIPSERALGFTASVLGIAIVTAIVMTMLSALFSPALEIADSGRDQTTAEVAVPGVGRVDMGKLKELGERLESMPSGTEEPPVLVDAAALKAMLPESLPGGFARTRESTTEAANIGMATVAATYQRGDDTVTLTLTDMGAAGAIAAITGALGLNTTEQSGDAYRRLGNVDGRMTNEEYNPATRSGNYGVLVGDRVMVKAEGTGVGIDELKAVVTGIEPGRIEALLAQ